MISSDGKKSETLAVIVPVLNEARHVDSLLDSFIDLRSALLPGNASPRLVIVDDGSQDGCYGRFLQACRSRKLSATLIRLRRNFGKDRAVQAALAEIEADMYVIIDADQQTPMSLIPDMVDRMREQNVELVNAVKKSEPYGLFRKLLTYAFFRVARMLSIREFRRGYSDFILFSRSVRDALTALPEKEFVVRSMIYWFQFPEATLDYTPAKTQASRFPLPKLFSMAVKSLVTFSNFLRINFILASLYWFGSLIYAAVIIYNKLNGRIVTGLSSTLLLILVSFGLLFFMIAIIGEILKIIFAEIKSRPGYFIERVENSPGGD